MRIFLLISLLGLIGGWPVRGQLSKAQRNYIDLIVTPDHADWNYEMGEKPDVRVKAFKSGILQEDIQVSYEAGPEMMPLSTKGNASVKNGEARIALPTMKAPGFLQCKISVQINGHTYSDQIKLGFSPRKISPTIPFPADFQQFWEEQIKNIADLPLDFTRKRNDHYSTDLVSVYEVSYRTTREGYRMNGWLMIPNGEGTYPAVVMPPGAGIKPQIPSLQFAEMGIITLQLEVHGLPLQMSAAAYDAARLSFGDYMFMNLDDRQRYYYNRIFLGCKRAVDVLCSLPECNGKVGATGGSQGGALAIVTTALDRRVSAVVSFYPALCDVTGYLHGRAGGWPHLFAAKHIDFMNKPEKVSNIAYYDVVNFARTLTVPGFYSFGYNDNVCPPTSVYSAINVIRAPKEIRIEPVSAHWRYPETNRISMQWLVSQLGRPHEK